MKVRTYDVVVGFLLAPKVSRRTTTFFANINCKAEMKFVTKRETHRDMFIEINIVTALKCRLHGPSHIINTSDLNLNAVSQRISSDLLFTVYESGGTGIVLRHEYYGIYWPI